MSSSISASSFWSFARACSRASIFASTSCAVDLVGAHRLLVGELLLLEVGLAGRSASAGSSRRSSRARRLLGRQRERLRDARALPPLALAEALLRQRGADDAGATAASDAARVASQALLGCRLGDVVAASGEVGRLAQQVVVGAVRPARGPLSAAGASRTAAATGDDRGARHARGRSRASDAAMPTTQRSGCGRRAGRAARRIAAMVASSARLPLGRRAALDLVDLFGRRAPAPRPSTPGARGCRPGSAERCRGSASGSPAAGAASAEELGVGQVAFGIAFLSMVCLCLTPESRPAARGSSARRGTGAT